MSDIFDMQEDGTLCMACACYVGGSTGSFSYCKSCEPAPKKKRKTKKKSKVVIK